MPDVDTVRIEISAVTFGEFGVTAVHGISESCEECHVAVRPADVFGRATPGGLEEKRLIEPGTSGKIRSILMVCSQPSPKS